MAAAGCDLGAWLPDNGQEGDILGQRGLDVPDLPVHIPGHAAALVSADRHAVVSAEHQVCDPHKAPLKAIVPDIRGAPDVVSVSAVHITGYAAVFVPAGCYAALMPAEYQAAQVRDA